MRLNTFGIQPTPKASVQFGARYSATAKGEMVMGGASLIAGLATAGAAVGVGGFNAAASTYASTGGVPLVVGGSTVLDALRVANSRGKLIDPDHKTELPQDRMIPLQKEIDAEKAVNATLSETADQSIAGNKDKKFGPFSVAQLMTELFGKQPTLGVNVLEQKLMASPTFKTQLEADLAAIPQPKKLWERLKTNQEKAAAKEKLMRSAEAGLRHLQTEKLAKMELSVFGRPRYYQLTELGMTVLYKLKAEAAASGKGTEVVSARDARQSAPAKIKEYGPEGSIKSPQERLQYLESVMGWHKTVEARLDKSANQLIERNKEKRFGPFTFAQLVTELFSKSHMVTHETLEERLLTIPAYKTLLDQKLADLPKPATTWQKFKNRNKPGEVRVAMLNSVLRGVKHLQQEIVTIAESDSRHNLNHSKLTELGATVLMKLQAQQRQAAAETKQEPAKAVEVQAEQRPEDPKA